jgi:REP element-mobilizing transposase RayT
VIENAGLAGYSRQRGVMGDGLWVLNYVVTSNHIHLRVKDTNQHVIAKSLQLIAGRTAQEYNLENNAH